MAKKAMCLVCCSAGFATSTMGAKACEQACKELGLVGFRVEKRTVSNSKMAVKQLKPDLILIMSKTQLDFGEPYNSRKVEGISIVTGKGKQETIEEMKAVLLKSLEEA